ncbi:bifunctional phosphoribosylaminoimidazolecarboxamide formyltransferase/IMP cyclohydrolase [Terrarubrum flagellatum]|uniref:bifunctional phosphoribosylaminoimidazolecarboxamide formyltransferase/IMP cyclohydrolase n=1 Tax=Terrirubrum flagellatum TaxID=2895980 RepID=UPI0031453458
MPSKLRRISRALLSVSDKAGLVELAQALAARGVEILSTGGSRKTLAQAGVPVKEVADVTGFPEIMDGRVKTLHPRIHGGLLAVRENPEHSAAMLAHGIEPIDLLISNLYPFEQALAGGASFEDCVENIDIGGPAMIRAASKNFDGVTVIVDPADYAALLSELAAHDGATSLEFRTRLAAKAFARTSTYDSAISNWLAKEAGEATPTWRSFAGTLAQSLRYGENPHQSAAFYRSGEARPGVATARQVQGKELSYNNLNDTDAAYECVAEFDPADSAACVIVKHANPCGVGVGRSLIEAYRKAFRCDSVSAFGGIVAFNRKLDRATAEEITQIFTEVVIAPDADEDAIAVFAAKKNLRLLLAGGLPDPAARGLTFRSLSGGLLVQDRDAIVLDDSSLRVATKRAPTAAEMSDLRFAFRVAKHVKSNAIVYARDGATVGVGAGQMSRVDSARIAAWKSEEAARAAKEQTSWTRGSVAASDAFFPFADGLQSIIDAGATAVIQPGGSMRDAEVIAAADAAGIAMVLTGIRHFRH